MSRFHHCRSDPEPRQKPDVSGVFDQWKRCFPHYFLIPKSIHSFSQVYGDKDADGFYQGESAGRLGFVPCNMVSEIQVEDEETRQQLLQQGFLSTAASMEKIGMFTASQRFSSYLKMCLSADFRPNSTLHIL